MLTYARESLRDIKDEVAPLLDAHWREIALDQDTVNLDPLWESYEVIENVGAFVCVTARDDGLLVGYAAYIVARHLHYQQMVVAENDVFFLHPGYRKGLAGPKMFKAAEKILADLGVHKIVNKVKLHHDVGAVFERMGYRPIERIYVKDLRS